MAIDSPTIHCQLSSINRQLLSAIGHRSTAIAPPTTHCQLSTVNRQLPPAIGHRPTAIAFYHRIFVIFAM
jgi:hypothetical protein